ncbi:vesicle-associated membrane protein 2 [Paragonimus westermani]|uniref:Vesicle-associated membrane protein 2 n=1 Tax=Paragonimus westermani TaxID=34504 RepID=A0A5J4N703_9TREM|nr:vesicle-associated membrane protein 2 [Paragonimus westermani]
MANAGGRHYDLSADNRIKQEHEKVQEVVGIMRDNVSRVLEREAKLAEIDTRADELQVQSRQFESASVRVRRKFFWQNMKMWGILAMVAVAIVVVIVVWIASNRTQQSE